MLDDRFKGQEREIHSFASEQALEALRTRGFYTNNLSESDDLEWQDMLVDVSMARYEGQVRVDTQQKEGFGIMVMDDGSCYEGSWRQDK